MSWQGILGHDAIVEQFRRGLQQSRLATTFLFVGPTGIGKRTFAKALAKSLLCTKANEEDLKPCGTCAECQQVESDTHPDLQQIQKPADRAFIPVETFIGDREHRMRTGLCHFISLTASNGKRRIAIIDDADWLNVEGANSLLKTLEEPSPGAIIILISTSLQRQLPTIRSRSQVVRFHPLTTDEVATCLVEKELAETPEEAQRMASRAEGSVAQALTFANESTLALRSDLWTELAKPAIDRGGLAKLVNTFADSNGKETAAKRNQLRIVFESAIEFYRAVARCGNAGGLPENVEPKEPVANTLSQAPAAADIAIEQVDRCLDALREVRSNANLGILVDAWVCDLATITRTQQALPLS